MKTTIFALLFFMIPFVCRASSNSCEHVHSKTSTKPSNYDLRMLSFEFFEILDRKPVEGGFKYSIGIKAVNQKTPAPQKGKIGQFLSDLPQFALHYGFEVGKDPMAGDLFTHDTNTHLVAFLTMPLSVKNWMNQRLKDRLDLLELAEKTGSQNLIDFASKQLEIEVKHIDSFTANMSLSRTNRIDEFFGHDVLQATANYIYGGLGGLVPESYQAVLRNLGIDLQNNLNVLEAGLSRNDLAELKRLALKTYPDITREKAADMSQQWIDRTRHSGN